MSAPEKTLAERIFPDERAVAHALENGAGITENMNRLSDHLGLAPEKREQLRQEHVEMISGAVNPEDAKTLHDLITRHTITPATEEEYAAGAAEARKGLREAYGDEAHALLAEAQKVIAANPRLRKTLEDTGLGNHPRVTKMIIDRLVRRSGRHPL